MKYSELKSEIEKKIIELAELIEDFCVIDNNVYAQAYKNQLRDLHRILEEIIK
jgi:hypothetical protein